MGESCANQLHPLQQVPNLAPIQTHAYGGHGRRSLDALPHELVNFVFAYTSYHKATIAACTLVSRSWRALSTPHLFSSLTVVRRASFADLDDFLDRHPHIASCIRELDLKHAASPRAAVTYAALARLVAKLPGLQVLRLRRLWLLDPRPSSHPPTTSTTSRPVLKALALNECFTSSNSKLSLRALHRILDMFPADSLSLRYLTVTATPELSPGPDLQSQWNQLHAHILTVQHVHAQYLFSTNVLHQTLLPQLSRPRRTPDSRTQDREPLYMFSEFLRCIVGEQLRYLEFPSTIGPQNCPAVNKPGYGCVLHVKACCNVESITFQLHIALPRTVSEPTPGPRRTTEGQRVQDVPLSAFLIAYLPHLPSTIRNYTLRFLDAHSPAHMFRTETMDLEGLDEALLKRFPLLTTVQVILPDAASTRKYSQAVIQAMPKCGQRRFVSVVKWKEVPELDDWW
ncbi:hypothetical protein C8Q73DRAFT_86993 [Cubamyces lactineus]|nr:hypothetical protein C8Q73DRAFT_86993 [Cubamyces lactineus]